MHDDIKQIGIIGAGLVGASWAAFFSGRGCQIKLYDTNATSLKSGYQKALACLDFLRDHDLLEADYSEALSSLTISDSLEVAVDKVDLVLECATERYDVKQQIFHQVDRYAPTDTIIASASSALLITEIQKGMQHPQRSLIAHPFNPPHLVPLVELVAGKKTDPTIVQAMVEFLQQCGKAPIVLRQEVPGYLANRLQAAVWREAIDMVLKGVATVHDVDLALCCGPGIRWALMGQHLIYHLGGGEGGIEYFIDHIGKHKHRLWEDMATWTRLPEETARVLSAGIQEELGTQTIQDVERWRDKNLVELLKVINK